MFFQHSETNAEESNPGDGQSFWTRAEKFTAPLPSTFIASACSILLESDNKLLVIKLPAVKNAFAIRNENETTYSMEKVIVYDVTSVTEKDAKIITFPEAQNSLGWKGP